MTAEQPKPAEGVSVWGLSARQWRTAALTTLATIIRVLGAAFALIMVAYVVLTVGQANPANGITRFVSNWATLLSLGFEDLFTPSDPRLRVLVNFGLAALFWLVVSSLLSKFVARFA